MSDDEIDIWDQAAELDAHPVPGLGDLPDEPDDADEEEES